MPLMGATHYKASHTCRGLSEVVLNEGVQDIKYATFNNCISLERITIPSTVTEISYCAFSYCPNLRDVVLYDGIKRIRHDAFHGCRSIQRITTPSTVNYIGSDAFMNCSSLREVIIVNFEGVQIKSDAFTDCTSLERFKFPHLSTSTRLNYVIQVGHTDIEAKMDDIPAVEWRGEELAIPAIRRRIENRSRLSLMETVVEVDKEKIDRVEGLVRYYEKKEATTLFELALWKANLDQASEMTRRSTWDKYRIEVPGPVKDTILQYLS